MFRLCPQSIVDRAAFTVASHLRYHWLMRRLLFPSRNQVFFAALSIVAFVGSWRTFMWPLIVSSSEDLFNLPLGLSLFRGIYTDPDWPLLMAGSMIMTLPMILVFIAGQRYFVEGIRLGAVKG